MDDNEARAALAAEVDRPYTTRFTVQACVEASSEVEAQKRAMTWGMDNLSETTTITPGVVVFDPCPAPGLIPVSLTGTLNFIGTSQAAAEEKVREVLERAGKMDISLGVHMGAYQITPIPEDLDELAAAVSTV